MGYSGMGAREDSSGATDPAGRDHQDGNAHLRRIVDRSGVGLSASAGRRRRAAETPSDRE